MRLLHGYKVLICGNRNRDKTNYERRKENKTFNDLDYSKEEVLQIATSLYPKWSIRVEKQYDIIHFPFSYWNLTADNKLFDEVYDGPLMISKKLILSHEPLNIDWAFNIHGHIYNKNSNDNFHKNVCSDVTDYYPMNLNRLILSKGR